MLDSHRAMTKVYVLHAERQGLRYAAAEVEEKADEQPVSEIGGCTEWTIVKWEAQGALDPPLNTGAQPN